MRQELATYIKDTYSEEKANIFVECFNVLDEYALEDYDNSFIELLMETGSKDFVQTQMEFELLMKNTLLNLCFIQGVQIDDEAELSMIKEVTYSLLHIQHYEDSQSILDVIGVDFGNEEMLCELFRFVSSQSLDRFMTTIESVNEGIFVKLREIHTKEIELQVEDNVKEEIINRLKILKSYLNDETLIGFRLLSKSASLGLRFEHYFLYIKLKIEDMEPQIAAKQLLLLMTMSSDTYCKIIEEFAKRSNKIFTDLDKISKVNIHLVKMVAEFEVLYKSFVAQQKKEVQNA